MLKVVAAVIALPRALNRSPVFSTGMISRSLSAGSWAISYCVNVKAISFSHVRTQCLTHSLSGFFHF